MCKFFQAGCLSITFQCVCACAYRDLRLPGSELNKRVRGVTILLWCNDSSGRGSQ